MVLPCMEADGEPNNSAVLRNRLPPAESRVRPLGPFFSRRCPALGGIHALPPGIRHSLRVGEEGKVRGLPRRGHFFREELRKKPSLTEMKLCANWQHISEILPGPPLTKGVGGISGEFIHAATCPFWFRLGRVRIYHNGLPQGVNS